MKDLLKYALLAVSTACILYTALLFVSIIYVQNASLKADSKVTTAVFGNSVGETSINDTILDDYANYCISGTSFYILEDFIYSAVDANPRIKRIVLTFDPNLYHYGDDGFNNASIEYYRNHFPLAVYSGFKMFDRYTFPQVCKFLSYARLSKPHYGYSRINRRNIHQGQWSVPWFNERHKELQDIPYEKNILISSLNLTALRRIADRLISQGKEVVILSTPTYHLDNYFGRKGYNDYLSTLNDAVLIADYSDFQMPSDDYYGDVVHLNDIGSDYFSNHIKEFHLKSEPLKTYLQQQIN